MNNRKRFLAVLFIGTALVIGGCGAQNAQGNMQGAAQENMQGGAPAAGADGVVSEESMIAKPEENLAGASVKAQTTTLVDTTDIFSERDLEQEADLTDATYLTLESGNDVTVSSEGVYVIQGTATESTIIVEADDTAKVQLVLDGVSITNSDAPAIYVKSADKVFVTVSGSENSLAVTGAFTADGETNTDAVIFSKDDLVLNGTGSLTITSTGNGISGKDDLKVTGGKYIIEANDDALEAQDSISISGGSFAIKAGKDAIHCENADDTSVGYVYISGGEFGIEAGDDGIQATTALVIDGGTMDITAAEGMEATYVQINDGTVNISASDDGINASSKSSSYDVTIEINGGNVTIDMGEGDTDALDTNGNLYINGGTVTITAQFAFDFDGEGKLNGGTVTVNGETVTEITNSMMMGGPGGFGNGERPSFDGNMPQLPEGMEEGSMPQMPEGMEKGNFQGGPGGGFGKDGNQGNRGNKGNKGNGGNTGSTGNTGNT